jgi:uncharacterized protein
MGQVIPVGSTCPSSCHNRDPFKPSLSVIDARPSLTYNIMDFEWDETKSEWNHIKRGLPFTLAIELFKGFATEKVDSRRNYGEVRMIAVGQASGRALVCIYTDRGDVRRIISLRDANRRERHAYRSLYPG